VWRRAFKDLMMALSEIAVDAAYPSQLVDDNYLNLGILIEKLNVS
jgi:hypothetical protein